MENKEMKNMPMELEDEVLDDVSGGEYGDLLRPIVIERDKDSE